MGREGTREGLRRARRNGADTHRRATVDSAGRARPARGADLAQPPRVLLGPVAPDGVATAIYGLVERGTLKRPDVAAGIFGLVQIELLEGYPPVRIQFDGEGILVEDVVDPDRGGRTGARRQHGRRPELTVRGSLPHVSQLAAAPLVGGVPSLASARGRSALARFWSGDVRIEGSPLLARRLLKLLEL